VITTFFNMLGQCCWPFLLRFYSLVLNRTLAVMSHSKLVPQPLNLVCTNTSHLRCKQVLKFKISLWKSCACRNES